MIDPKTLALALPARLSKWTRVVVGAAAMFDLDPLVIFALMDRESGGGIYLSTKDEKGVGDGGNGLGLMQIDRRYHPTFVAALASDGKPLWQKPWANVSYCCGMFRDNADRWGSELCAVAAHNCSPARVILAMKEAGTAGEEALRKALDGKTTGGDYVTDVLRRRDDFRRKLIGVTRVA